MCRDLSSKLPPMVSISALVFTPCLCEASRSARSERRGPSHFLPGQVHSPSRACGLAASRQHGQDFGGLLWASHPPVFPLECFISLLLDLSGTAASGVCNVKFSVIGFSKCPKDNSNLHGATKDVY